MDATKTKPLIDWDRIGRAVRFYEEQGFKNIDVPWCVSEAACRETMPANCIAAASFLGWHVGSAEQSFIQMLYERRLPIGRWQATTPCFRDDPEDELHSPYFMKVELISLLPGDTPDILADTAMSFLRGNLITPLEIVPTSQGLDIVTKKRQIEVGSYGYRTLSTGERFVYGTGLAEPRASIARMVTWE